MGTKGQEACKLALACTGILHVGGLPRGMGLPWHLYKVLRITALNIPDNELHF